MDNFCLPAIIYLLLGIAGIVISIFTLQPSGLSVAFHVFLVLLWTWLLDLICSSGFTAVSWLLILLPLVIAIVFYISAIDMAIKKGILPTLGPLHQ